MQPLNKLTATGQETKRPSQSQRHWLTPFTFGAFILTAVTGILLFFKINIGLVKPAHEWLSWLMVIAAVFHLVRNRRAFAVSLNRPVGKAVTALFFLLLGASLLPFGGEPGGAHQQRHSAERITEALTHAPLATVAKVANRSPEETIQFLWRRGINTQNAGQSIREIAENNRQQALEVLALIFQG